MKISRISETPFHTIAYEVVTAGAKRIVPATLPLLDAVVDHLPTGVEAIVVAADLQGREPRWQAASSPAATEPRLLGELLADELEVLSEIDALPALDKVGVILAGDMFAKPDLSGRGGKGDVRGVWHAFARECRWVVGVAGNHDAYTANPSPPPPAQVVFDKEPGLHLLDGDCVDLDGMSVAGISGIVGNPRRPWRRDEPAFAAAVRKLASDAPEILVLHDGPDVADTDLRGWKSIRKAIESAPPQLVIRGHDHWTTPLGTLANGSQVLNVDSRVVVLRTE